MAPADEDAGSAKPPQHPVPQLQGPFEESMMESLNELEDGEQNIDSVTRRKLLLQGEKYERVCAGRWKQRAGEKFHPLWKLSAQLSFGIHLLAQGLAKSEEEVMRILQSHVDDIDGFLERTTEDFDLAQVDVEERLRYLRLPLEHVDVFDHMLEDRTFRSSIVEGNEKIEHIVERTSEAMKDALKDVQKGIDATGALGKYLTGLKSTWNNRSPELEAVYVAMLGNVEGWARAFMDLHLQGNRLAVGLVQLAGIIAEMQRRAGVASRKILLPYTGPASGDTSGVQKVTAPKKKRRQSPELTSSRVLQPGNANTIPNKPLPLVPDLMVPARQASRAKLAHEEKLRRRSMEVLREQEERAKLAQAQTGRKSSIAEKVRSISKRGSAQALSGKTKSPKQSDAKAATPSKLTSPPTKSPKLNESDFAAQSSAPAEVKAHSPRKDPDDQLNGAIELPGDVPRGGTSTQETPRKGGLHIHIGSKHKNKDHSSMPSSSKSLNLFRRSPHSQQPLQATNESRQGEATTSTTEPAESPLSFEAKQQVGIQLSPPSVSPHRQSPDPGLPTPPALASHNFSGGGQPNSYTALPDVLATAQRAKSVKASLTISVPSSADPESERTPRAVPSQRSEAAHTKATLAELPSDDSKTQAAVEDESKHTSYQSNLGEPGPEIPSPNTIRASEEQVTTTRDDDKTPTKTVGFPGEVSTASAITPEETNVESIDAALTSATMRSFSDFCKLPPQQTSPTPPPITPDDMSAKHSIASNVASPVDQSKPAGIKDTVPSVEQPGVGNQHPNCSHTQPDQDQTQADGQLSSPSSPQPKRGPREPKVTNPKELRLKPRTKDLQNQSELLDVIASTPPHSPIHARAPSDGSGGLNAVGMTASTSRILAPPEEAPPPPAPGGRSMIAPDYASAGAFEGERKSRRGSAMSTSGWKKMFTGGGSASTASPGNGLGSLGVGGSKGHDEEIHMSANLMSGEGNDVLWYKGMGRDGLWVSGA